MKKGFLSMFLLGIITIVYAQPVTVEKGLINKAIRKEHRKALKNPELPVLPVIPATDRITTSPNENTIGYTYFDLQSNGFLSNRFTYHPDGTMGAVWIFGETPPNFPGRGTGYNYYNGSNWGNQPSGSIETIRCGWPSYDTWGTNGEINVSHNGTTGLQVNKRATRGSGSWDEMLFQGPPGIEEEITWPRLVTSGNNNTYIHMVYNSHEPYQGQDAAMLYSRSNDGGNTWNPENIILPGTGSDYYNEILSDNYVLAARDSVVAILVGNAWMDLFVLKSTDNGSTWTKTVIWQHPYPFFDWNATITDTFFCVDNSASVALGPDGQVHVAFGISRVLHDQVGTNYFYFRFTDGIGYWNEGMPVFSNDIHALAPPELGYPGSEMVDGYNFIGYSQDLNENGQLDFIDILAYRQLGVSTMPTICVDNANNVFVAYASSTESYDNYIYNFKKIWVRARENGVWGDFYHATEGVIHFFDESIYPIFSHSTDTSIHLIYQADLEPGLALDGDHGYISNNIIHSAISKSELITNLDYYTVTTTPDPAEGGSTTGDGSYPEGQMVTISAGANANWDFIEWTENGTFLTSDTSFSFYVIGDRDFVAHFQQFNGTVSTFPVPPEGGSTYGNGTFPIGDTVTVTASANENWEFTDWTENGATVSADTIYSFELNSDVTLLANFYLAFCTVGTSSDPPEGGITSGDGTYPAGDSVTVTATANSGWFFESWTEDGTVVSTDTSYTFEVNSNTDLVANFLLSECTLTTSSNPPEGGTTSGDGTYMYLWYVTVTASPDPGWAFDSWTEDGTVLSTDTSYSFVITENRDLEANFSVAEYSISTEPVPPEGGVTSGDGYFNYGDMATVIATSNEGWDFTNWSEDTVIVSTDSAYTFQVAANRQLIAGFEQYQYTINAISSPPEGGTATGGGTYKHGDTVTLTATASQDWEFFHWTENSVIVSYDPVFVFSANHSCTMTANFDFPFGLETLTLNNILIYPVPSSGTVTVSCKKSPDMDVDEIAIYELSGKLIRKVKLNNRNKTRIDLSGVNKGVYLITYRCRNNHTGYSKIVIH